MNHFLEKANRFANVKYPPPDNYLHITSVWITRELSLHKQITYGDLSQTQPNPSEYIAYKYLYDNDLIDILDVGNNVIVITPLPGLINFMCANRHIEHKKDY